MRQPKKFHMSTFIAVLKYNSFKELVVMPTGTSKIKEAICVYLRVEWKEITIV